MKTKEFVKQVEAMGYRVKIDDHDILRVYDMTYSEDAIIYTDLNVANDISTDGIVKDEIFNLSINYVKTPLQERKTETMYGVKSNFGNIAFLDTYTRSETETKSTGESRVFELPTPNGEIAEAIALLTGGEVYEVTE